MRIIEVKERTLALMQQLLEVWEQSVKATHLFLSSDEIEKIKEYVPDAISKIKHLVMIKNEEDNPVAFMGVEAEMLEMLFIMPEQRGNGLGKCLLLYGMEHFGVRKLTVNEQNPQAKGFYEHMGFQVYKRTDFDEQGNAYPLFYMSCQN
ncbi:MAG: GNAT family N-acetyltransferase [Lachnospiraceae bacterium]|nr:GNAT family N-acetyltransferase [Lachnospiraceae bacterium]